jgi:hypothetical protein
MEWWSGGVVEWWSGGVMIMDVVRGCKSLHEVKVT